MSETDFALDFQPLPREAKKCMRLAAILGWGAFILLLAAARTVLFFLEVALPLLVDVALAALLALIIAYIIIVPAIRWRRYKYLVDEEKIVVREGLWFIATQFAPIERVHQLAVQSGPLDRRYGLAKVIATTAGGTVEICFLEQGRAEELAAFLTRRVRHVLKQQGVTVDDLPAIDDLPIGKEPTL